jgi:hypothetical protein
VPRPTDRPITRLHVRLPNRWATSLRLFSKCRSADDGPGHMLRVHNLVSFQNIEGGRDFELTGQTIFLI